MDDKGRTTLVSAVTTPLGMFVLLALIVDGIIAVAAASNDRLPMWAPLAVLVLVVVLFAATLWWKDSALYGPSRLVVVKLLFPVEAPPPNLDLDKCTFEVRDADGKPRLHGAAGLKWGHGGWTFNTPLSVRASESILMLLVERDGQKWEIRPFDPFETVVQPVVLN